MFSRCALQAMLLVSCTSTWAEPVDATLVHRINIVAQRGADGRLSFVDPRGLLTQVGPGLGLSADEIHQARNTTGYVFCPGTTAANSSEGSAALIGRGDFIIAAAHEFIDETTGLRREPLTACFFQTQGMPSERAHLDFSEGAYKFFTKSPHTEFYNDVAVVRLKRPLTDWAPFPFDSSNGMNEGEELIEVSALSEPWPSHLPPLNKKMITVGGETFLEGHSEEPLVQRCTAMKVRASYATYAAVVYSDCAGKNGQSGSVVLVREHGRLAIKAIHVLSGHPSADFKPYAEGRELGDSEKSYSYAVIIDSTLLEEIKTLVPSAYVSPPCGPQNIPACDQAVSTATPEKSYDAFEARAKASMAAGKFQEALIDIEHLLAMHKSDTLGKLSFMRAESLLGTGDFARADEAIHTALEADRDLLQGVDPRDFYYIRGRIFEGLDQIDDAIAAYNKAVGMNQDGPLSAEGRFGLTSSYYSLARIALNDARLDEGMDYIDNFLRLSGDSGNAYFVRGRLEYELKRYDDAIADFNKAESLRAGGDVHLQRGIAYSKKKDFSGAIIDLTASIAAHPNSEQSYLNRASAYMGMSDQHPEYVGLGFADFDKAEKLNGDDISVFLERGFWHQFFAAKDAKDKRPEAALAEADLQKVLKLAPSIVGGCMYYDIVTMRLEQIHELLGQPAKPVDKTCKF